MVHLKLTPDKVLISAEGQVKLCDLRLNRAKKLRWDSVRKKSMDGAAYLPPEQFTGEKGTEKCDLYALGVIFYEMLTGKLPHTADSFSALAKLKLKKPAPLVSQYTLDGPIWMEQIVQSLLQTNPEDRPFGVRSVIVALDDVRKADRERTGVAEKLISGFSPLTAGKDRSEARKVLGLKSKKHERVNGPFLKSTGFLLTSLLMLLLVMGLALGYGMRANSPRQLYARAVQQVDDENNFGAQKTLRQLLERPENEYTENAEILLVQLRAEKLMERAEHHPQWSKTKANTDPATLEFFRAFELERMERFSEAIHAYETLLSLVSYENLEERHLVNLAVQRMQDVEESRVEKIRKDIREGESQKESEASVVQPGLVNPSQAVET
ncbi:MAG: protein kinase, partial [Planctomycetota bacterium]|nr:protein kinase [Planctomycetota bacterium]